MHFVNGPYKYVSPLTYSKYSNIIASYQLGKLLHFVRFIKVLIADSTIAVGPAPQNLN